MTHDNAELPTKMRDAVREHWKALLIEGILLVIFGLAAMIAPPALRWQSFWAGCS